MAKPEKLSIYSKKFETDVQTHWKKLQKETDFYDVTLACDDKQVMAHKVVLSSCSSVFSNILKNSPKQNIQNTLIYLYGIKASHLDNIVNFVYQGKVDVAEEELNEFLTVSQSLKIIGLSENEEYVDRKGDDYEKEIDQNEISVPNKKRKRQLSEISNVAINHLLKEIEANPSDNQTQRFGSDHEELESDISDSVEDSTNLIKQKNYLGENELEEVPYPCKKCDKIFLSELSIKNHILSVHKINYFSCQMCDFKSALNINLKKHTQLKHGSNNQLSTNLESEIVHQNIPEKERKVELMLENTTSKSINPKEKLDAKTKYWNFSCEECGKLFARNQGLQIHTASTHKNNLTKENDQVEKNKNIVSENKHPTEETNIVDEAKLNDPLDITEDFPASKNKNLNTKVVNLCKECNKTFTRPSGLKIHLESVHDGARYPCTLCAATFKYQNMLGKHMKQIHKDNSCIKKEQDETNFNADLKTIQQTDETSIQDKVKNILLTM